MKQIWQLCKSVILNLVHKIVQNFSIWCAFTCLMRQNTKLHFWKVPKMRLKSVLFFNVVMVHFSNIWHSFYPDDPVSGFSRIFRIFLIQNISLLCSESKTFIIFSLFFNVLAIFPISFKRLVKLVRCPRKQNKETYFLFIETKKLSQMFRTEKSVENFKTRKKLWSWEFF